MNAIRNIYFRSSLNSCNYQCSYCSFGRKKKADDLDKDRESLQRFYEKISTLKNVLKIMFIPYGEGLIHKYYREYMIRLSLLPQVEGISCQTNLSFSSSLFLKEIESFKAEKSKLKLWASFHPEMVGVDTFVKKAHQLFYAGIELCVGAVGCKENKHIIEELRKKLDKRIYLFINALQGSKHPLKDEDNLFFTTIDPLYAFDFKNAKANPVHCRGGKDSFFVNANGDMQACPRSSIQIGNLYDNTIIKESFCNKKRCDCYIAYSNLEQTPLSRIMGNGALWRIPEKRKVKAIFFDIDGTLTDSEGNIPHTYQETLTQLSKQIPLYLATSLPLQHAKRRLGPLFNLFADGIFADGGHLRYNQKDTYIPILPLPEIDENIYQVKKYTNKEQTYKYVIKAPTIAKAEELTHLLHSGYYNLYHKGRLITLTNRNANKKNGLLTICQAEKIKPDEVAAIGNTMHDWLMLSATGYPCAVINADKELRQLATYAINPDQLPLFFTPYCIFQPL
ncbi:hydroxymethylpyrimidine pyrophosphatase-like HAD family hydrolase [Parabacteroides sp. PF5-5]|uniref:STM4011 family radical SAM protein n=1 Tax=unclassified Parabacteroides TaxID=2649774 RepID=UPI00247338D0|nr:MULTISPECIES: STM4011 family radical SAM protein [unclassified Parabacteroides]MDH6307047.1 hydroxymethylpyrimidine pyrophosphatase-like HAD family hydrolase [Parabacteroides sp. PH5-39]MDH6317962.1 hydroxymethylpyrimidine pyrophosphatase-like HAD family hydrolase [Parabacteroides sp. PF5-13]MDH6321685.1 hydroxymethylpyrimidine pyrophosphatase-like HAD family hydrolase [Parabacteroides sp. PH5-13]MDH6325436.1 hydroxymethylpyrimidine pyrophosphatase-like HAD family hydrolase [Parabacteroides 